MKIEYANEVNNQLREAVRLQESRSRPKDSPSFKKPEGFSPHWEESGISTSPETYEPRW
jgi:hypothetical protein